MRVVVAVAVALGLVGYWAAPSRGTHAEDNQLQAIVGTGDGFDIGLFFPNGDRVVTLAPGTYTVVVHDRSAIHNFHLASNFDSTVDFKTEIPFVGDQSFTVTFRPDTEYAYACEPHWQVMNGKFRTLALPGSTTTTAPPRAVPNVRVALGANGAVTVAPASVTAGTVHVSVRDRSSRFGARLAGNGVKRSTTASFVGTVSWTVRLAAGTYRATGAVGKPAGILKAR